MDLIQFVKVLFKRKWLILGVFFAATTLTFLVTRFMPRAYFTKAQLATGITENQGPTPIGQTASKQWFEITSKFNNLIERMKSRQAVALLSYELILHDLEGTSPFRDLDGIRREFTPDQISEAIELYRSRLSSISPLVMPGEEGGVHVLMLEEIGYDYKSLMEDIKIDREKDTDYINVAISTENPHLSAFVVNRMCQLFIRYYDNVKASQQTNSLEYLVRLENEKKTALDSIRREYQLFRERENILDYSEQAKSIVEQIRQLEVERDMAQSKIPGLGRSLENIKEKFTPGQQSYVEATQSTTNAETLKLQGKLRRLNDKKTNAISLGKDYAFIQDSINIVKSAISKHMKAAAGNRVYDSKASRTDLVKRRTELEVELQRAEGSVKILNGQIYGLRERLSEMAPHESELAGFMQDIKSAEEQYNDVIDALSKQQYETTSGHQVSQIEPAQAPSEPESSKALILVALAGIVSVALTVVILFLLEYIDTSIKLPSNFEKETDLELLGVLNQLDNSDLDLVALFKATHSNVTLETFKQLLRKIRYEIIASNATSFMITSPRSGTGKTSLLLALSYSLSLNKKRVLLIDTNFRNNALTRLTGATPTLEQAINNEDLNTRLTSQSGLDGVDIIGCKGGNYTPAEVFASGNFKELLNGLSIQYDFILMEGAALNTFSDARELTTFVDKVLPIFSAKSSVKQPDKLSIEYLAALNGKLLPSVLNKVEMDNLDE